MNNDFSYIKDDAILEVQINDRVESLTKSEFIEFMNSQQLSISSCGVLYSKKSRGLLASILDKWYSERKEFKKKMIDASKSGDKASEEFYDKRQLVQKILLNSLYGVLGLPVFRFYDLDNAESVTLSGQDIIKATGKKLNSYYKKQLVDAGVDKDTVKSNDYITYTDTDSVAGTSIVNTNLYGKISLENLFSKLEENNEEHVIDSSNREFIFPKKLKLPFYDEENKKIKTGNVDYIEKHKIFKKRFKIKTKLGKEIIVSEDHSIMVLENSRLIEKKPTELSKNDEIITI